MSSMFEHGLKIAALSVMLYIHYVLVIKLVFQPSVVKKMTKFHENLTFNNVKAKQSIILSFITESLSDLSFRYQK